MTDAPQTTTEGEGGAQGSRLGGTAPAPGGGTNTARKAGRGFLLISGAKMWFMVMGALVSIGLPALMPPDEFGIYSIITNVMSLLNMVVITGTVQAVSKLVSERPEMGGRRIWQASLLQCFVGLPIAALYIVAAPWIAASFNDPSLTGILRVSGGVIFAYAFYAIFVGYLNGAEAFGKQALLDVTFATVKAALIMTAVLLGYGVLGAVWGFVIAAVAIVAFAPLVVRGELIKRRPSQGETVEDKPGQMKKLASFLLLVMLFTFAVNGVLRADLFLVKSLSETAAGVDANAVSGVYAAMLNLSRIPYQAVIAVTFIVFPMISKATFEEDIDKTRAYIRSTLRYSVLMLVGLGTLLAACAPEVVHTLYGARYAAGALPLGLMSLATVGFATFFIATTMITGAGRPVVSLALAAVMMVVTVVLNYLLVGWAVESSGDVATILLSAAGATATAMLVGCGTAMGYLGWRYRAFVPVGTAVRLVVATACVLAFGFLVSGDVNWSRPLIGAFMLGKGAVGAIIFAAVLLLGREVTAQDKARLLSVVRRGKTS